MKRMLLICLIVVVATARVSNGLTLRSEPDYRFAWSTFAALAVADSVVVLAGTEGISTAVFNAKTEKFDLAAQLPFRGDGHRLMVFDSVVAVFCGSSEVYFFDRFQLPALTLKGHVTMPDSTRDFLIIDGRIYVAAGFRGLLWGDLTDYSSITNLDSSQIGVHVVSLCLAQDRLVLADDYNGLLEYRIDSSGVPSPTDLLLLPFQGEALTVMGDSLLISAAAQDSLYIATWGTGGWEIVGSTLPPFGCERTYVTDTFVVAVSRDLVGFSLLTRRHLTFVNSATNTGGQALTYPGLFTSNGIAYLVYPEQSAGLALYVLTYFDLGTEPREAYALSGQASALTFLGPWLVAGGSSGWCHGYAFSSSAEPDTEVVVYDNSGMVGQLATTQFGVAILNSSYQKVNLVRLEAHGPRPYATYFLGHGAGAMYWHSQKLYATTPVAFWNGNEVYLYDFTDSLQLNYRSRITVPVSVRSVCVVDSFLILSVAKFGLQIYVIKSDYSTTYQGSLPDVSDVTLIVAIPQWPRILLGFRGDMMYRMSFEDPVAPRIDSATSMPFAVSSAYLHDSLFFTTSSEATAIWRIPDHSSFPVLIGSTDRGGIAVAGDENLLAMTNGRAIYTFDLRGPTGVDDGDGQLPRSIDLLVNYPNPFNPTTTIAYTLSRPGAVSLIVYNILGRRVRVLEQGWKGTGRHELIWDGRDDADQEVASGTYFARLTNPGGSRVAKMLLVR
jgi:hypothetical protein